MITDKNLIAFTTLIRTGEGTLGYNGYRTLYGGSQFESYDDHPRKKIKAGKWTSTAAGAYQILERTWDGLVKQHPSVLVDFTPDNQDAAAIYLIKGRGAYDDVIAGRFKTAILKCNKEWASLPLAPYGQPTLSMEKALKIIANAGGEFAVETPVVKPETEEKDMSIAGTIISNAIPKLVAVLPELAAIVKKSDVSERNVELVTKVGSVLMETTAATNEQEAVERVLADPQTASEANMALRTNRADLFDIVERINMMDQANIKDAREHNSAEPFMVNTRRFKLKFIHILSLVFVLFAGIFVSIHFTKLPESLQGAIITLMIIGGWNGVRDYWMGSSEGSARKTDMLVK